MSFLHQIKTQFVLFWRFLGFFQPPGMRVVHAIIVVAVVLQLISSGLMSSHAKADTVAYLAHSWHILFGLMLVPVACFFTLYAFQKRGIKRYFGYLWGEVEVLLADLKKTLKFQLVAPRAGGLATVVQGLGFGALLLTLFSGAVYFASYRLHWPETHMLKEAHEFCATLLMVYFCGHGGMALLHFVRWRASVPAQDKKAQ